MELEDLEARIEMLEQQLVEDTRELEVQQNRVQKTKKMLSIYKEKLERKIRIQKEQEEINNTPFAQLLNERKDIVDKDRNNKKDLLKIENKLKRHPEYKEYIQKKTFSSSIGLVEKLMSSNK